uniref:Uncharacterized protein n=1 Tax=Octopus bimaculoides TaxID=37653 RepID=A0A0L8FXJ1_OCTBM
MEKNMVVLTNTRQPGLNIHADYRKMSLRNDDSVYKFKARKEIKTENHLVTEYIPITKVKIHPDKTAHNLKIVIGLFAAFMLLLIIFIVTFCIR